MRDRAARFEVTMKILLALLARAAAFVASLESRTTLRRAPVVVRK
jgi:hypothetical protein